MNKHDHHDCAHVLKFCAPCNEVYCAKCEAVWSSGPCLQTHYPWYVTTTPTVTIGTEPWDTTTTWGTSVSSSTNDTLYASPHSMCAGTS